MPKPKRPNPIEAVAGLAGEYFNNNVIIVLNKDGETEYRFDNRIITKTLMREGIKDLTATEPDLEIVWDDDLTEDE